MADTRTKSVEIPSFKQSAKAYDGWLRQQAGKTFVAADMKWKNQKISENAFSFLRGTYWRFAETILKDAPETAACPPILAVGDIHLENFGLWRDADSRMTWGVNDFDEAATMPYALDLVRLGLSAILARKGTKPTEKEICARILRGYRKGIAQPQPTILEQEHDRLREAMNLPPADRSKYWAKMQLACFDKPVPSSAVPAPHAKALRAAMPDPKIKLQFARRVAGTGSLGRPRFVAWGHWRGGIVLRESKMLCASAWRFSGAEDMAIQSGKIAGGTHRAPDPNYRVAEGIVVRRLGPTYRKIEAKRDPAELLNLDLLEMMGFELGACHAGDAAHVAAVRKDVKKRTARWLRKQVNLAGKRLNADFKSMRKARPSRGR